MLEHNFDRLLEHLRQQVDRRDLGRIAPSVVGTVSALPLLEDVDAKKEKTTATPAPITQQAKPPTFVFDKLLGEPADEVPGLLPYPVDVATDGNNNLYVLDADKSTIVKFSPSGNFMSEFGSHGQADGELEYPNALAVDHDGWMYVADSYCDDQDNEFHRLQVFDENGDFYASLQPDAGALGNVSGIAVTSDLEVFAITSPSGLADGQIIEWVWDDDSDEFEFFQSWQVPGLPWSNDGGLAAVDDDGRLYVGYSEAGQSGLRVFDTTNDCELITTFSSPWGQGNGQFKFLSGIAVDSTTGHVFVTDNNNCRVQKLVWNGDFTTLHFDTQFGTCGSGFQNLNWPGGVIVDANGNVHIADGNNARVLHLQNNLTNPSELKPETGAGQIFSAWAVAQDASKNYYIIDGGDYSIHKLNNSGHGLLKWGGAGSANGKFAEPYGIAVKGDQVYVTDYENSRIQVFDTNGVHTSNLRHPSIEKPIDLVFDAAGNLYVSNAAPDRIEKFDVSLNHVRGWGGPAGFAPGPLAVSPTTGFLYVLDYQNEAVQVFTTYGAHMDTYPVDEYPDGIGVDASGRIYVGSDDSRRLEVLTSSGALLATLWWDDMPEMLYAADILFDKNGKLVLAAYGEPGKRFTQTAGRASGGEGKKADRKKRQRQDKHRDRAHGKGRKQRDAKHDRSARRDADRGSHHAKADRHAAPPAGEATSQEREHTHNPNKRD